MNKDDLDFKERLSRIRRDAGRRGGLRTLERYGVGHMKVIGLKGARVFHRRYKLVPIFENDFAIVDRETNNKGFSFWIAI